MPLSIRSALEAQVAIRYLGLGQAELARSTGRLSSGLRVRTAADDAAALNISTGMSSQLRGLQQSVANLQNGVNLLNVGDGALNEGLGILQRMRELAVEAHTSVASTTDRLAIGAELLELRRGLDNILDNTQFNTQYLFRGADTSGGGGTGTVTQSGGTLTVGTMLIPADDGPGVSVTAINVAAAQAGQTYTFTSSGASVTLTSSSGVSQSIQVSKLTKAGDSPQALNFNLLGVIVTLTGWEGPPAVQGTPSAISSAMDGLTIITSTTGAGGGGTSGSTTFVINPLAHGHIEATILRTQSATLGAGSGFFLSELITDDTAVSTESKVNTLAVSLDVALQQMLDVRGSIGAQTNMVESYLKDVLSRRENLDASRSRIVDMDLAQESVAQVRATTLQELRMVAARSAEHLADSAVVLIRSSALPAA